MSGPNLTIIQNITGNGNTFDGGDFVIKECEYIAQIENLKAQLAIYENRIKKRDLIIKKLLKNRNLWMVKTIKKI